MAKLWVIEYEVLGYGRFPVDMLRYDVSYPAQHVENIFQPDEGMFTERNRVPRTVRLHSRQTFANWEPTYDRWSSFGWHVNRHTIRHWSL